MSINQLKLISLQACKMTSRCTEVPKLSIERSTYSTYRICAEYQLMS